MKVPFSWLKQYVDIDVSAQELETKLFDCGFEVEELIDLGAEISKVVVGVVTECVPQEGTHLHICKVDCGDYGHDIQISTGAPNVYAGMHTPAALDGSTLPGGIKIKAKPLMGIESNGMLCSGEELGLNEDLYPGAEVYGLLDLPKDTVPGTPIQQVVGLDDYIFDISITANRADCQSVLGIAREVAAVLNKPLKMPATDYTVSDYKDPRLSITVEAPDLCPRYLGHYVRNITTGESPRWMRRQLALCGLRSISNVVDITNYVMLATGNPTHAYDADNITDHIVVRQANEGEKLILLNDEELNLCPDDLVITDSEGPVGLAGVMGGAKDSILPDTKRVILEVANFEATGIRRTTQRYDFRTEASSRYEKAVDPERCVQAVSLAMKYFHEFYPELKVTGYCDQYVKKLKRAEIDVSLTWLAKRLGKNLTNEEIRNKLELLGFDVAIDGDNMHVTAPTWRSTGDISIKDDVMEEVARMYGYDNFEATSFTTTFEGTINQRDQDLIRNIKEYLAIRCGMQEVYTYPWMNDVFVNAVLQDTTGVLRLSMPPAPDLSCIRSSLLPNLCEAVVKNERYFNDFSIFEEAQVFFDRNYPSPYDETESLPEQRRHIGGAFASTVKDITELFREAKGVLEYMPRYTHMEAFTFRKEEKPVWADNVVWLNLFLGEEKIGDMGLVAKKVSMECGIKNLSVMLFEMDATKLKPLKSRTNKFTHLAEYPETDYDISMLFDSDAAWEDIYDAIMGQKKASALLKEAAFVDEYRGKQIPDGKKSVTIRLTIGSGEKTLTSQEIESAANQVMKKLGKKMGAELRTQ
mgnify:CR=1 FL=1